MTNVNSDILKKIYKERKEPVKKYDFGLLLVIGGSEFYSGSPALAALAAFRAGTDMVRIVAPKRSADIIASFKPDLAAYPLQGEHLTKKHVSTLLSMTESAKAVSSGKTAVVIGGGVGRNEETQSAILEYLSRVSVPVIVDADAIHAVSKNPGIISGKNFVFTPHTYEFFILTGKEIYKLSDTDKVKVIEEQAARLKVTMLIKGKVDIISNGDQTAISEGGSIYMTKGGMGDTLAGICGGLLARGTDAFEAACAASYINKKAGEIAVSKLKESVMASDLIESIPEVINNY